MSPCEDVGLSLSLSLSLYLVQPVHLIGFPISGRSSEDEIPQTIGPTWKLGDFGSRFRNAMTWLIHGIIGDTKWTC